MMKLRRWLAVEDCAGGSGLEFRYGTDCGHLN